MRQAVGIGGIRPQILIDTEVLYKNGRFRRDTRFGISGDDSGQDEIGFGYRRHLNQGASNIKLQIAPPRFSFLSLFLRWTSSAWSFSESSGEHRAKFGPAEISEVVVVVSADA